MPGPVRRRAAALINDHPYARKTDGEMLSLVTSAVAGGQLPHEHFHSPRGPFKTDPYASPEEHYGALEALLASGEFAGVIDKIKGSNLRGMGGAGSPAFRKWDTVPRPERQEIRRLQRRRERGRHVQRPRDHEAPAAPAGRGDDASPASSTGADKGYIYIRHEYHEQIHVLEQEIDRGRCRTPSATTSSAAGKDFDLEVFVSPGGYVQGEETALLEAIEGQRGQPRNKPHVAWRGVPLHGPLGQADAHQQRRDVHPTSPRSSKGPEWFAGQGSNGCHGLKWVGVGGDVDEAGRL